MKKIALPLMFVFLISFMLSAQEAPKPITQIKPKKIEVVKPLTLETKVTGWVIVVNCIDRYIEIVDAKCIKYKINVKPDECARWNLTYGDRIKVIGFKSLKDKSITAKEVRKAYPQYLDGKITVLNCIDKYIEISFCNGLITAKVYVSREVCNQYQNGQKIRVYGAFKYSSSTGLTISNPTINAR
jgi:hypothetical protein